MGHVVHLLACSGPGAPALMDANRRYGWIMFAIAAAFVVAFALAVPRIRRRRLARHLDLVIVLLIHPGVWMPVVMGDCGMMRHTASTAMTLATPVLCALVYWRTRRTDDPARV